LEQENSASISYAVVPSVLGPLELGPVAVHAVVVVVVAVAGWSTGVPSRFVYLVFVDGMDLVDVYGYAV